MKTVQKWLVVNYRGEARLLASAPRLRVDEVAYRLVINIPQRIPPTEGRLVFNLPEWRDPVPTAEVLEEVLPADYLPERAATAPVAPQEETTDA